MRLLIGCLLTTAVWAQFTPLGYTGGASSPIPTPTVWYSADCITYSSGSCSYPSNGSTVSTWDDRSGHSNNLGLNAHNTAGGCVEETNALNSLPVVQVAIVSNCFFNFTSDPSVTSNTYWYAFAVIEPNTASSGTDYSLMGCYEANNAFQYYTANVQGVEEQGTAVIGNGSTTLSTSSFQEIDEEYSNLSAGDSLTFNYNGSSDGPSSFTAKNIATCASGGGTTVFLVAAPGAGGFIFSQQFVGYIAEFILYTGTSAPLTSTQVTTVQNYLTTKYGL